MCPRTALHLGILSYIWGPGMNLGQPAPFHSGVEDEMGVQVSSRQGRSLLPGSLVSGMVEDTTTSLPEPGIQRGSDLFNPLTA